MIQRDLHPPARTDEVPPLDVLKIQLTHGDYHDEQVIFFPEGERRDEIAAVVDWETYRVLPRVHELIRAVSFAQLMPIQPLLEAYLRGYGGQIRLNEEECRSGVELWWHGRLGNTWIYETYLFEKNERAAIFFAPAAKDLRQLTDPAWREGIVETMILLTSQGGVTR